MWVRSFVACLFMVPTLVVAQPSDQGKGSTLTVYSDNHEKFVLVLNGKTRDNVAKDDIKLSGLTNEVYDGKIIFQDESLPILLADIVVTTTHGKRADAYYNIRRTLDGTVELHFLTVVPINEKYLSNDVKYFAHKPGYGGHFIDYTAPIVSQTTTSTTEINGKMITSSYKRTGFGTSGSDIAEMEAYEPEGKGEIIDLSKLQGRQVKIENVHADYINTQSSSVTEEQLGNLGKIRDDGNGQYANMEQATNGSMSIVTKRQPYVTFNKTTIDGRGTTTSQDTVYKKPFVTSTVINEHPDESAMEPLPVPTDNGEKKHANQVHRILERFAEYDDNQRPRPAPPVSDIDTTIDNGQMVVMVPARVTGTARAANTPDNNLVTSTTSNTVITKNAANDVIITKTTHVTKATTTTTPGTEGNRTNDNGSLNIKDPKTYSSNVTTKDSKGPCASLIDVPSFDEAKTDIGLLASDDNKLSTCILLENNYCFTAQQIYELCLLFTIEQKRLEFAKASYAKASDHRNYHIVYDAFRDDISVIKLKEFIKDQE